jgi:hypothetical protein
LLYVLLGFYLSVDCDICTQMDFTDTSKLSDTSSSDG